MAKMKLTSINPLISENEAYQTAVNCRAVLHFMSMAVHENSPSESQEFGRYLILETIRAALADVERALEPGKRQPLAVVVNG